MDNLLTPAHPFVNRMSDSWEDTDNHYGFTKLELASLMIAQGMIAGDHNGVMSGPSIAKTSVIYAKLILEEANK